MNLRKREQTVSNFDQLQSVIQDYGSMKGSFYRVMECENGSQQEIRTLGKYRHAEDEEGNTGVEFVSDAEVQPPVTFIVSSDDRVFALGAVRLLTRRRFDKEVQPWPTNFEGMIVDTQQVTRFTGTDVSLPE